MKTIHLKKLPSAWHELTLQQIYVVSKLYIRNTGAKDFLVRFFVALTGWKLLRKKEFTEAGKTWFWFKDRQKGQFLIDGDIFTDFVKQLEWVLKDIQLISVLPSLLWFKPVNVRLYEVTLDEYLFLDTAFAAYVKTRQRKYLNRMLAIIYRTKAEGWNSAIIGKKSRLFGFVPFYKRHVVFLWFVGLKAWLKTEYPFVWQSEGSGQISHAQMILNLLSSLNNGDITRNSLILKTHVHEAFYELNLKAEQAAKLKNK